MRLLSPDRGRVLLVVPTPIEAQSVLIGLGAGKAPVPDAWRVLPVDSPGRARFSVVVSGIGKANAAGATSRTLAMERFDAVLNVGIAGTLDPELGLGSVVLADRAVFADEGVARPDGFDSTAAIGFAMTAYGMGVASDAALVRELSPAADRVGVIATVSTCSGTDALAREIRARTGAIAETMEGAAVGLSAEHAGIAFVELRVISNTTGERRTQRWDVRGALSRLGDVISRL